MQKESQNDIITDSPHLVNELRVPIVILQQREKHVQPLRLEEEDAALVVTQECLKHRKDREEAELLVLGVALSLGAYKIHQATYGLLLGGLQERHLSAEIE